MGAHIAASSAHHCRQRDCCRPEKSPARLIATAVGLDPVTRAQVDVKGPQLSRSA